MNKDGVWVGTGQQISVEGDIAGELIETDIAGFWITGLMSPFVIGGIGGLARAMAQARQAVERGDDDANRSSKM
jgi:heme/copper-type cytochrome/quinol oxidase subunit 1